MDLRRLRAGEWMIGLGSVLLIVALLLPWYDGTQITVFGREPLSEGDYSFTGFEALGAIDLVLVAGALFGLAGVAAALTQRTSAVALAAAALLVPVAIGLVVIVLLRVAQIPDLELPGQATVFESERAAGLWLALASTLLMLAGALVAIRDERLAGDTRHIDPVDVPTRPAPQP